MIEHSHLNGPYHDQQVNSQTCNSFAYALPWITTFHLCFNLHLIMIHQTNPTSQLLRESSFLYQKNKKHKENFVFLFLRSEGLYRLAEPSPWRHLLHPNRIHACNYVWREQIPSIRDQIVRHKISHLLTPGMTMKVGMECSATSFV